MRVVNPGDRASTYAAVLDALPISAFMANPDGVVTYLSSTWVRYTGNDAERVIGDGFRSIIHPDDRYDARKSWIAAQIAKASYRGEYRMRFGDGSYRWMLSQAEPMFGDGGDVVGWFGTLTDIDDLKRTQSALAESEAMYRAFNAAIPGITWSASPAGDLTFVGDRWSAVHDESREAALGDSWLDRVYPGDRERVLAVWARSLATGEDYDIQFRVQVKDGSYRWFLVRALPVRDDAGNIVRWFGVNVDVDDQRKADEAREQFVRLAEASDDFVGISDDAGYVTYLNEAGRRMLGIASAADAIGSSMTAYFSPNDLSDVENVILPAIEREGRWSGEFWMRNVGTGERIPVTYNAFTLRNHAGDRVGMATVSRDIRERQRVDAGLLALAETGAAMFGSLDFEETLRNIAFAATRSFATYCIVDTVLAHGSTRLSAAVHKNTELSEIVMRGGAKRGVKRPHPVARALFDGESTLVPALPVDWITQNAMDASTNVEMQLLAPRSLITVPVRMARTGPVVAAITFVVDAQDPRGAYSSDDLRFAEEIALRAGVAFDNVRAYQRERRIAVTLQDASLPKRLPKVDGFRFSADYRPGSNEATIGGDWYDAFVLDDGRIVVTIGDVLGNGLDAAVTMSRIRQAMRSVAMVVPDPNAMLDIADRTVREESGDTYATAMAGIVDPHERTFTFASAGQSRPMLRNADGSIEELAMSGLLLGLRPVGETQLTTVALPAHSTLVFYTDGLVEATHDLDAGYARLRTALSNQDVLAAANPARALVDHVLDGQQPSDDIAVLLCAVGEMLGSKS
jgi:PAS domain S-box-containing protein